MAKVKSEKQKLDGDIKRLKKIVKEDTLMLPSEAAAKLTCDERTLANWRSQEKGPRFVKVGGLVRYWKSDIDKYLLENYSTPF